MEQDALIVVDIQNDFIKGGALAVPEGEKVIPLINVIMEKFDLIVATQDWHPANHKSFAVNHPGKNVGEVIDLNGLPQVLWPVHCVQNTPGAELVKTLNLSKITKVFVKGTDPEIDSYSGFYDNGHRKSTGLGEYLKEKGVKEVYVCGLATDYCVKHTVLDALSLGFYTYLIRAASRAVNLNPKDEENAVKEMRKRGVDVLI
ncbi:MAG: bifunctional nicotinamidase/pyrazinamidase [Flammeovirgaceae bacterium]|nr:bifunctional nicotinamidase/pyrazinamidase [Flammeovirgaceae bacterium]MDW8288752.1 bifunctional nicotinamidase/pyrazinamidase [Flammeovirgaceae bacterium]